MKISVNSDLMLMTDPSVSQCGYHDGDLATGWQLIKCDRPMRGRYVRADLLSLSGTGMRLALYEVLIYGY